MVSFSEQLKQSQKIWSDFLKYQRDPMGFSTEILGMPKKYIWSKMTEVCEAIRDHQRVAIRAGHNVSKTFTMGRVVIPWFKVCFVPSTVVTTAPSDMLVKNQLWREVHASYSGAKIPLGGQMQTTLWDCKPRKDILERIDPMQRPNWEKNFAIGFSTSPDSTAEHATKMQGWHNEWVLVVIDEACGILPQIWTTVDEALITDEQCKCVAIGNPTDPESNFAKACYSSDLEKQEGKEPYVSDQGWYVVTIDARDNPNYISGKRLIPGLASKAWVERIMKKYGPDGDGTRYRVKGLFPTFKEGTYYGKLLADARKDNRVGKYPMDPTYPVCTASDYGDRYTATIYFQVIQGKIRIFDDYWDNEGLGAPAWAKACDLKGYNYADHVAGPDFEGSNARNFATGQLIKNVLINLGYHVRAVDKLTFDAGIEAVRSIWPMLEINENCLTFLQAAAGYGKKKNAQASTEEQTVYHDQPAKFWGNHMMDALRHLAIAYRNHQVEGRSGSSVTNEDIKKWQKKYGLVA